MRERTYICCDLKSFYASVECVERGLDPMTTNLVVADERRTDKTICLAVSPSLKAYGIPGRARLFEVVQRVKEVNAQRQRRAPGRQLTGASWHDPEVRKDPALAHALDVSPLALTGPDIDSDIGLMHTLFALEDTYGLRVEEVGGESGGGGDLP